MEKKEVRVLNAIPADKTLEEYFDSLDIFDKREMINDLKYAGDIFSNNFRKKLILASISFICSFVCYFGIRETWFIYYLILINFLILIFTGINLRQFMKYYGAAKHFEKRLSE